LIQLRGQRGHLQAAEQAAQRLGVAVECCAAVAGEGDRGAASGSLGGRLSSRGSSASEPATAPWNQCRSAPPRCSTSRAGVQPGGAT